MILSNMIAKPCKLKNLFLIFSILILYKTNAQGSVRYSIEQIDKNTAKVTSRTGLLGGTNKLEVETYDGIILNTTNNNVKIDKNDLCVVISVKPRVSENTFGVMRNFDVVVCKSGKVIENVCQITGSSTGTPPNLEYKNYIGSVINNFNAQKSINKPGARSRTIYYICD